MRMQTDPDGQLELLQRLQDSEYRYANLFEAMPACFFELDFRGAQDVLKGWRRSGIGDAVARLEDRAACVELMRATRVINCNERAVDVFGKGSKDAILTTVDFFWPPESNADFAGVLRAVVDGQPSYSCETIMLNAARERLQVLFTACYPKDLDRVGTILVGILDQTGTKTALAELKRAKLRADTLSEAQAFATWELDCTGTNKMLAELRAKGVTDIRAHMDEHPEFVIEALDATIVTDVNQKAIELYGMRDKNDAIGRSIRAYWLPGEYEAYEGSIEAGFNGKSRFDIVTRSRTCDGRILHCRFWMASPPEMRTSGVVFAAIQDLTEEIAAQREIERLRDGLAHAGRVLMMGEFAASIAHEINQPLAALRAASSAARRWLAATPPDLDKAVASLENIAQSAHRAGEIVDRIRSMAVRRQPKRERVQVRGLVEETVEFVSREFHAFDTVPVVNIQRAIPDIFADRIQIQQVLVNLFVNALQAMGQAQSPVRRVSISVTSQGDDVEFAVEDTGPGFAADEVKRLFDHFYTTKEGGMGIGLTICQSIIQGHDGRIAARNVAGGGAEFTFALAAAPPHTEETAPQAAVD